MKARVKPDVILILGMHRSGTSAMARVMSLLGARLPKSILGKNDSNARGHWESEQLIAQHEALLKDVGSSWQDWRRLSLGTLSGSRKAAIRDSFIDGFNQEYPAARNGGAAQDVCVVKEPRICRFAGLYLEAMDEAASGVHSVIALRHPLEVAASLTARDKLPKLDGLFLWLTHMLEAELATRGRPRSFISYEGFLNSPFEAAKALVKGMEFKLPYSAQERRGEIEAYVSPSLKRHSRADEDTELDALARGWVSDSYKAFQVLTNNPASKTALKTLDNVREEYFGLIEPLAVILGQERSVHEDELSAQAKASETVLVEQLEAAYMDCAQQLAQKDRHIAEMLSQQEALIKALRGEHEAEHIARLSEQKLALQQQSERAEAVLLEQTEKSAEVLAALQTEIDTRAARIDALTDEMDFMRSEFRTLLAESDEKIEGLYDELAARDQALAQRSSEAAAARGEIQSLLSSTSWKLTAGFRGVVNLLRGTSSRGAYNAAPKIEDQSASVRLDYKPWENDPHG